MDPVTQARLRFCNWDAALKRGDFFKKTDFQVVDALPEMIKICRAWDFAQTAPSDMNPDPDYTVGLKMGVDINGTYYVMEVIRFRQNAGDVELIYKNITSQDGIDCISRIPRDPGGMADLAIINLIKENRGYNIKPEPVIKSKENRASSVASMVRVRNVKIMRGKWNKAFFIELEHFPYGLHDDQVDALSDAFNEVIKYKPKIQEIKKPVWLG